MNYKEAILKASVVHVAPVVSTRERPSAQEPPKQEVKAKREKPKRKYIAAVISPCYGGYGLSKFAMRLYRERYQKKFGKGFKGYDYDISREDPILVDLVKEFPDQVSDKYAELVVVYYLSKYENFFIIDEYDGNEGGDIDVSAYKLHTIKTIATSSLNAEDKVQQINALLDDPCEDAKVLDALPTSNVHQAN